MSFTQGAPTQPMSILASNVFLTGSSTAGNAFTVQQLGAGNVASFQTSTSSTSLIINPSGNVGIGKTNPGYALDVTGDINFTGTFRQNGTAYVGSQWTGTTSLYFVGNVGIGTNNAGYTLDVRAGGSASVGTVIANFGQSGNSRLQIIDENSTGSIPPCIYGNTGNGLGLSAAAASTGDGIKFYAGGGTVPGTERMRITKDGNVGIGVTNPSGRFSVVTSGDANIGSSLPAWTSAYMTVGQAAGTTSSCVGIGYNATSNFGIIYSIAPTVAWREMKYHAAYHSFHVASDTPSVTINSTGVGIGTASPSKLLQVWGGMIIGASSDSRATTVTLNAPGATVTFSPNSDIGDGARIMCLQCPDLSSTTANLVSFSLQVAPTGSFGTQRTSLDLKGFRVANQSYGGFCITSPFDTAGSYDLFYADRTKAYFQQNVGIGKTTAGTALDVNGTVTATTFSGSAASLTSFPTLNQNTTGSSGSCTGNSSTATTAVNQSGGTVSCTTATSSGYFGTAMVPGVATRSTGGFYVYSDGNFNIEMMQRTSGVYGLNFITRNTDGVFSWRKTGGTTNWGTELMFLDNGGNLIVTGDITALYSDERLKTKTGALTDALAKVCSLDTFTYRNNDLAQSFGFKDDYQRVGVSAQQVQKVLPEAVRPAPFDAENQSGQNYLTVQYEKLVPLLIEALKEEKHLRWQLEERVRALEEGR
jgi:hypothetical protein